MARPVKNYCDYFPHDRDMRNHRKVKAIRTKFGIAGYGIWCMTLEYLTGIDGNVLEFSETELELMSGDYGVSATEIRNVLDYCVKLELLFLKDGFLHSESLDERLKPVYDKRGISKSNSKKQSRVHGKFTGNNTDATVVSGAEMPQSKVKESKEDKSKANTTVGGIKPPKVRKSKKDPEAEPYWKSLVKTYFSFCYDKFKEKPSFDGSAPSDMHRIIEALKKRAQEANVEWSEENANLRWRGFLGNAYQDNWLSQNWLLSNLNRQKDKVFLGLVNSKNGSQPSTEYLEQIDNARKTFKPIEDQ